MNVILISKLSFILCAGTHQILNWLQHGEFKEQNALKWIDLYLIKGNRKVIPFPKFDHKSTKRKCLMRYGYNRVHNRKLEEIYNLGSVSTTKD